MSTDSQLDAALDLMRRLPPERIDTSLSELVDLVPTLCEDLLSSIDQPLKIARDPTCGKEYLLCDYNRDGDSYRSPWSNRYDPPLEDGAVPSDRLRRLEEEANQVFEQYKQLYYEGGVSSVYLWELSGNSFAGVVLIKKGGDSSGKIQGSWDSIHVIEVQEKSNGKNAHYKLTSTVMLWLKTMFPDSGTVSLGGSLMRQFEQDTQVTDVNPHVVNIGKMVEEAENKIKVSLSEIYFSKTLNVVNGLRCKDGVNEEQKKTEHLKALESAITKRNKQDELMRIV